jgi:hypothetical protein
MKRQKRVVLKNQRSPGMSSIRMRMVILNLSSQKTTSVRLAVLPRVVTGLNIEFFPGHSRIQ